MPTPDLSLACWPRDLRTESGRAAAALDIAQAVMPGLRIARARLRREWGWWVDADLEDGTRETRPLVGVRVDASRSDKLPDGSLVCYARALAEAWEAVCGPRRGAA